MAYGRVFGWIVSKINKQLAPKVDDDVELSEIGKYIPLQTPLLSSLNIFSEMMLYLISDDIYPYSLVLFSFFPLNLSMHMRFVFV